MQFDRKKKFNPAVDKIISNIFSGIYAFNSYINEEKFFACLSDLKRELLTYYSSDRKGDYSAEEGKIRAGEILSLILQEIVHHIIKERKTHLYLDVFNTLEKEWLDDIFYLSHFNSIDNPNKPPVLILLTNDNAMLMLNSVLSLSVGIQINLFQRLFEQLLQKGLSELIKPLLSYENRSGTVSYPIYTLGNPGSNRLENFIHLVKAVYGDDKEAIKKIFNFNNSAIQVNFVTMTHKLEKEAYQAFLDLLLDIYEPEELANIMTKYRDTLSPLIVAATKIKIIPNDKLVIDQRSLGNFLVLFQFYEAVLKNYPEKWVAVFVSEGTKQSGIVSILKFLHSVVDVDMVKKVIDHAKQAFSVQSESIFKKTDFLGGLHLYGAACMATDFELVAALLSLAKEWFSEEEFKQFINITTNKGNTVIHEILFKLKMTHDRDARENFKAIAKLLYQYGPDLTIPNIKGFSAVNDTDWHFLSAVKQINTYHHDQKMPLVKSALKTPEENKILSVKSRGIHQVTNSAESPNKVAKKTSDRNPKSVVIDQKTITTNNKRKLDAKEDSKTSNGEPLKKKIRPLDRGVLRIANTYRPTIEGKQGSPSQSAVEDKMEGIEKNSPSNNNSLNKLNNLSENASDRNAKSTVDNIIITNNERKLETKEDSNTSNRGPLKKKIRPLDPPISRLRIPNMYQPNGFQAPDGKQNKGLGIPYTYQPRNFPATDIIENKQVGASQSAVEDKMEGVKKNTPSKNNSLPKLNNLESARQLLQKKKEEGAYQPKTTALTSNHEKSRPIKTLSQKASVDSGDNKIHMPHNYQTLIKPRDHKQEKLFSELQKQKCAENNQVGREGENLVFHHILDKYRIKYSTLKEVSVKHGVIFSDNEKQIKVKYYNNIHRENPELDAKNAFDIRIVKGEKVDKRVDDLKHYKKKVKDKYQQAREKGRVTLIEVKSTKNLAPSESKFSSNETKLLKSFLTQRKEDNLRYKFFKVKGIGTQTMTIKKSEPKEIIESALTSISFKS